MQLLLWQILSEFFSCLDWIDHCNLKFSTWNSRSNHFASRGDIITTILLSSHFLLRSDTLNYTSKEIDFLLVIPQPRINYCKRSMSHSGAVLWNILPLDIRQSLSLLPGKKSLRFHEVCNQPYHYTLSHFILNSIIVSDSLIFPFDHGIIVHNCLIRFNYHRLSCTIWPRL